MRRRHSMPFGTERAGEDYRFALWAPTAKSVALVLDGAEHDMPNAGEGWRRLVLPAQAGSRYGFKIDGDLTVPDPASRSQPDDVKGFSAIVDPSTYEWRDTGWRGRPWEETVVYETHVGTATPEGTFAGLSGDLDRLRDLGVTAIEMLPINEFPGRRNWGYDGVLPYAPENAYGTPDDLRRLIDHAHELGLQVFVDAVYNHFGPTGNYLGLYSKTFFTDRHKTPWGDAINFEGAAGKVVREYFIHNALYWLEEFNVDGIRFDAVHAIIDDSEPHFLQELAERARALRPDRHTHLVLENELNAVRWLARDDHGRPALHSAQWADDIHHGWHTALTGESEGYYEDFSDDPVSRLTRGLAEGFVYQGEMSKHGGRPRGEASAHLPPSAFVACLQNHDQVGNRAFGERLSAIAKAEHLALARAGLLLSPQIPMLFMGEEWGATAPFQFFVDYEDEPDLATAVREGRRREFKHFAAFSDEASVQRIPDPTSTETFRNSRVDVAQAAISPHKEIQSNTRDLLALRAEHVVPLTRSLYQGAEAGRPSVGSFDISWRFAAGTLRFAANLGRETTAVPAGESVIWRSPNLADPDANGNVNLQPWTGFFAITRP